MTKKPMFIRRKIDTKIQEYLKLPEILAIVGPRQSGKTTYLEHLIKEKGGKFISFEDVDALNLFNHNIKKFVNAYLSDTDLLCLDEFQYAKAGGKNLKYIFDAYKDKKIIISGSSAIDITIHALKYLVGRVIVVNFWPFDKDEIKTVFPHFTEKELYDYYSTYGGYPRVAIASNDEERKVILKNIYNTYFLREVKDILGLVDEYKIQKLLIYLAQSVGSNISYSKLSTACELNERDVRKYLEFMNKTFVAYLATPYFTNKLREIVKRPKAYFFDVGFLNHILSYEASSGKKLEQVVMMELIKAGFDVKYWRDKQNREMDFVVYKDNKIIAAIEAKRGGKYSESFNTFKRLYADIEASVITEETVFSAVDSLKENEKIEK
ncbi:MAG: ATP-binding protein [bacterium]|nr:ATP-binding protein [bacterium]